MIVDLSKLGSGDEVTLRGIATGRSFSLPTCSHPHREVDFGTPLSALVFVPASAILSVMPRAIRAGDRVYMPDLSAFVRSLPFMDGVCVVLAVDGDSAWLRSEVGSSRAVIPLSSLLRLPKAAPLPSERNP